MTPEGPIRLPVSAFRRSPPDVTKIKRGGAGKNGNSGGKGSKMVTPNRRAHPPRGPAIWDPRDPFIAEYRRALAALQTEWDLPVTITGGDRVIDIESDMPLEEQLSNV